MNLFNAVFGSCIPQRSREKISRCLHPIYPSVWEMRLTKYLRRSPRLGSWVTWGLQFLHIGYCRFQTRRSATPQLHPLLENDSPKFEENNSFPGCDASFWHHVRRRLPLHDGHLVLPTSRLRQLAFHSGTFQTSTLVPSTNRRPKVPPTSTKSSEQEYVTAVSKHTVRDLGL